MPSRGSFMGMTVAPMNDWRVVHIGKKTVLGVVAAELPITVLAGWLAPHVEMTGDVEWLDGETPIFAARAKISLLQPGCRFYRSVGLSFAMGVDVLIGADLATSVRRPNKLRVASIDS